MSKSLIEFTSEEKKVIMGQFFPSATTDIEMQYCMGVAKELGLNPILKEIWFVERKSNVNGQWLTKIEPMAGRDSYLTIAHRSGAFGGIESSTEIVEVSKLESGKWVETKDLVATAKVYQKGNEKPFEVSVNYNEYVQRKKDGTPTKFWNEKPHTMLKKVAESQALRKAFNISGVYDEAEIRPEYNPNDMPTIDADLEQVEHKRSIDSIKHLLSNKLKELNFNTAMVKDFASDLKLNENPDLMEMLLDDNELLLEKVALFENGSE